jgi:tol-pal system protein YbgF
MPFMAVLFLALILGGCATKRDVQEIRAQLRGIESNQASVTDAVERMDSLVTTGAEADQQLRGELRYSVEELSQQMETLLQNYNDLMAQIQQWNQQPQTVRVLQSSPGSEETEAGGADEGTPEPPPSSGNDQACYEAYDEAFADMLANEFDKAIPGFESYLTDCPDHLNAPNALYWTGQCHYLGRDFNKAMEQFDLVLERYGTDADVSSEVISQALYKKGRCHEELGNPGEAKLIYERVIDQYPDSFDAHQSQERLNEMP